MNHNYPISFLLKFFITAALAIPILGTSADPVIPGLSADLSPELAGHVLLSELNCAACHGGSGVPRKGAPNLSNAGSRIHPDYLETYIADPHATKPGTTMPDVLGNLPEAERKEVAKAISDYLVEISSGSFTVESKDGKAAERGGELYHKVGCVACHSPEEKDLADSVPLIGLENKYSLGGLTGFLKDPLAVRPGGRMPDMQLTHWEAIDLASYLLRDEALENPKAGETKLAAEGKVLFQKHGCAQCHQPGEAKETFAKPFPELDASKTCSTAEYSLSKSRTEQIASALGQLRGKPNWSPEEQITLAMTRLNCIACHERNDYGGHSQDRDDWFTTSNLNLGEQARVPPSLTGVGAKLDPKWLRKVLVSGASVRPYMNTRMPKFGAANVDALLDLFPEADRFPPADFERIADPKLARESGHKLVGTDNLGCVACHTWKGESATTLRGVELITMAERLQENWFHLYLRNPQQFHPSTIMPNFWPGGKPVRPEILDGNTGKQIDAIWQYLNRGKEARTPAGIKREPIEYGPANGEAVMLRRQYNGIGKRGIGVGYPSGINLSFDAGQMRLGSIWKGLFGEMSPVWRGQGSGNVGERTRDIVRFPLGPAFAILESPQSSWPGLEKSQKAEGFQFRGYSLDEKQRPTFRYDFSPLSITDQFVDQAEGPGLKRTITFDLPPPGQLYFRAAADKELKPGSSPNEFLLPRELRIKLDRESLLRDAGEGKELLVPLGGKSTVIIEYYFQSK